MPPQSNFEIGEMAKGLSKRLLEVLRLAAEGNTDKQIAVELGISPGTVATHWKLLRIHFSSSSRTEVVARAMADASNARQEEDRSDRDLLLFEIAQRKRVEEELHEANEKLAASVRDREDLLAKVMAKYERNRPRFRTGLTNWRSCRPSSNGSASSPATALMVPPGAKLGAARSCISSVIRRKK